MVADSLRQMEQCQGFLLSVWNWEGIIIIIVIIIIITIKSP